MIHQAIFGPRGIPNGMTGEIRQIKLDIERWREESKEENKDLRKSIRNLGFTVAGSVAAVYLAQLFVG